MTKLNSRLEAEGAEFLVLGQLLIEGIPTYKTYTRNPAYDLVATNAETNKSARIQVKSRWATDYDGGFLVSRFDFDFLVFVALNRGYRYSRRRPRKMEKRSRRTMYSRQTPLDRGIYEKSAWGKVLLKLIPDVESYRNKWQIISQSLANLQLKSS